MRIIIVCFSLLFTYSLLSAIRSDNALSFKYGDQYHTPGFQGNVTRQTISFSHSSSYQWGSNTFSADVLKSSDQSPDKASGNAMNGIVQQGNNPAGATEVKISYRHHLSLGNILSKESFFGPFKDFALSAGFNYGAKNTRKGPGTRQLLLGPSLFFKIPGSLRFGIFYKRESNNNAYNSFGGGIRFKDTTELNLSLLYPFTWLQLPFQLRAEAFYAFQKANQTVAPSYSDDIGNELSASPSLMVDVGSLFNKNDTFFAGVGVEISQNKDGDNIAVNRNQSALYVMGEIQL